MVAPLTLSVPTTANCYACDSLVVVTVAGWLTNETENLHVVSAQDRRREEQPQRHCLFDEAVAVTAPWTANPAVVSLSSPPFGSSSSHSICDLSLVSWVTAFGSVVALNEDSRESWLKAWGLISGRGAHGGCWVRVVAERWLLDVLVIVRASSGVIKLWNLEEAKKKFWGQSSTCWGLGSL